MTILKSSDVSIDLSEMCSMIIEKLNTHDECIDEIFMDRSYFYPPVIIYLALDPSSRDYSNEISIQFESCTSDNFIVVIDGVKVKVRSTDPAYEKVKELRLTAIDYEGESKNKEIKSTVTNLVEKLRESRPAPKTKDRYRYIPRYGVNDDTKKDQS